MKQLKQPQGGPHEVPAARDAVPDSRPAKPPAEYRGRRFFPSSAGATGLPAKARAARGVHPVQMQADAGGRRAKEPFADGAAPPSAAVIGAGSQDGRPDQQPLAGEGATSGEQYVRLRVRLRGDALTVLDSHLVDGPLAQPDALHGAAAYEVLAGDRLLHAAAVPDLGLERRSFPDPDDAPQQRGHHVSPRASTVFSVRVPADELTPETLGAVRVRLHRVLEPVHGVRAGLRSLAEQTQDRVEAVAELTGLPESVLPEAIAARGGRTGQGT